ncbi:TPA: ISL3 family transposase [Enterococcus faecium]|nr:ISL3 family transposase [Enterococcus faecalis]
MSLLNNIKKTCPSTTTFIKKLLSIKDDNITFPTYTNALSEEEVHGVPSKVFSGLLSYPENQYCCPKCGGIGSVIKHTPNASLIQMIPYQMVPTYLRLYKQRYRCKDCDHTFSATTKIVDENCYLSNALKFAILNDLKEKCSMIDIANRYFVSPKTVERILRSYTYVVNPYTYQLPECLLVDEFKGTKDCNTKLCFIFSDGETGKIIDILNDRRNFAIKDYFLRFSLENRRRVKYVVMDMNASYPYAIKEIFPNAEIIIDRFHIIQQLTRALNNKRIQVMKEQKNKESRHYTKLKKYWKFVLTYEDNLNYEKRSQYPLFDKKFVTQTEVVDTLLSFDEGFKQCYQIYQTLLGHFKYKEYNEFFDVLDALPRNLDKSFKKSLKYLTKHTRSIKNSLRLPYSNGKLEGKNNLIKVFQRVAFGFRNFENMRRRIFLYEENWQTKKPKKRKYRRKSA